METCETQSRLCKVCNVFKEQDAFYIHKGWPLNRDRICKECRKHKNREYYKTHSHFAKNQNKRNAIRRKELKSEVMTHYSDGEPSCACCGEKTIEFLAIDHIDGSGNKHRKSLGLVSGSKFYSYLKNEGYPTGYQVLCHNCNMAKGSYGYCPHQIANNSV